MREYNHELAQAVRNFLDEDDWHYSFNEEKGVFTFALTIGGKTREIRYVVPIRKDRFIVYAIAPVSADDEDADQMARMAEYICRANYGLTNGNFEMDYRDGEIRYKSFVDCDGTIPSKAVIGDAIYVTASMFKRYGDGMLNVIFTGSSPEDEIEKIEGE